MDSNELQVFEVEGAFTDKYVKWIDLIEHLRLYQTNILDLPLDHYSIISPIAIVLSQKRRLLKIHEIHNLLLQTDANTETNNHTCFILYLQEIIKNSHLNQWSKLEAQSIAALLTQSLQRCQADSKVINTSISDIRNIVRSCLDQKTYEKIQLEELRSSLILLYSVLKSFNSEAIACQWASDVLKLCNEIFKLSSQNRPEMDDCCLECLKILSVIFHLPKRFIDLKEKEKIPPILNQYMKSSVKQTLHSIEAADIYESMLENVTTITKGHVKTVLALLNGKLSTLLFEQNKSTKLLEHCFKLSPETSMPILLSLQKNLERARRYPYIDPRYFATAMAQVVIDLNLSKEDRIKIFLVLLPSPTSKSFVSPKCFGDFIFSLIYKSASYHVLIDSIHFVFKTLTEQLKNVQFEYFLAVLSQLTRLCRIYPECLLNVDISDISFALESKNEHVQLKVIELIYTVFKNSPTVLSSQATLIFARVKGEFVRINLREDLGNGFYSVEASVKMLAVIINRLMVKYSNYCDHVVLRRMVEWITVQFSEFKEDHSVCTDFNPRIVFALFLLATALSRYNRISIIPSVIDFMSKCANGVYSCYFIAFVSNLLNESSDLIDLFSPVLNQSIHLLNNVISVQELMKSRCLYHLIPIMKVCIENKFCNPDLVGVLAKFIAFFEYCSDNSSEDEFDLISDRTKKQNTFTLTQFLDYYAKLFWRASIETQSQLMMQWIECIKSKKLQVPHQILLAIKAILLCPDMDIVSNNHSVMLLEKVQSIVKHFILDSNFDIRVECGIIFGNLIKFIMHVDSERDQYIGDLFKQMMQHAISTSDSEQKSRVCYIVGIVTMKSNIQLCNIRMNAMDLDLSALLGLLASWYRECSNNRAEGVDMIAVAVIDALTIYMSNSGSLWGIDLFRDTCELVLEQVFMKKGSDKMARSIEELVKNLAFFANILNDSSQIIVKTIRLILESDFNNSGKIELLLDISRVNPKLSYVSPKLMQEFMLIGVENCQKVCSFLNRQIEYDQSLAFRVLDSGLMIHLLKQVECVDFEILQWLHKMVSITLLERFNHWNDHVFPLMNFNFFQETDPTTTEAVRLQSHFVNNLSLNCISSLLVPLAHNVSILKSFLSSDIKAIYNFLGFTVKLCFTITAEQSLNRPLFLNGLILFKGVINSFSDVLNNDGSYLIESYDPQMLSIISSAISCSAVTDTLYSAYAYGCLFAFLLNRPDLVNNLSDRVLGLLKKASSYLKEKEISWNEESVDNLVLLAILIGYCNLIKKYGNHIIFLQLDSELMNVLKFNVKNCIKSMALGTTERNIKSSLNSYDRLLLLQHHIGELQFTSGDSDEINVILRYFLLIEMSSNVCLVITNFFEILTKSVGQKDARTIFTYNVTLSELFESIFLFGISEKDSIAIECLNPLLSNHNENILSLSFDLLKKFSVNFLSNHFNEFDAGFGFSIFKSLLMMQSDSHYQDRYQFVFKIFKKLVTVCQMDLDSNYRKEFLLHLKKIFSSSTAENTQSQSQSKSITESETETLKLLSNETILELISLSNDTEKGSSQFIQQIVFFSISANPTSFWSSKVLKSASDLLMKLLKSVNGAESIETGLNHWILLVKSHSKINTCKDSDSTAAQVELPENSSQDETGLNFESFYSHITSSVMESFQNESNRNPQLDSIWSRYFDLAMKICENSNIINNNKTDLGLKTFLISALESLNDFK